MEPEQFQQVFKRIETEVQKVIVGHHDVIRKVPSRFFARTRAARGVPGLAKLCWLNSSAKLSA